MVKTVSFLKMSCQGCGGCKCGGQQAGNPQDEHLIESFKVGLTQYNASNNTTLELVSIESVTQQVVAGMKYVGVANLNDGAKYNFDIWVKPGAKEVVVNSLNKQ